MRKASSPNQLSYTTDLYFVVRILELSIKCKLHLLGENLELVIQIQLGPVEFRSNEWRILGISHDCNA